MGWVSTILLLNKPLQCESWTGKSWTGQSTLISGVVVAPSNLIFVGNFLEVSSTETIFRDMAVQLPIEARFGGHISEDGEQQLLDWLISVICSCCLSSSNFCYTVILIFSTHSNGPIPRKIKNNTNTNILYFTVHWDRKLWGNPYQRILCFQTSTQIYETAYVTICWIIPTMPLIFD